MPSELADELTQPVKVEPLAELLPLLSIAMPAMLESDDFFLLLALLAVDVWPAALLEGVASCATAPNVNAARTANRKSDFFMSSLLLNSSGNPLVASRCPGTSEGWMPSDGLVRVG